MLNRLRHSSQVFKTSPNVEADDLMENSFSALSQAPRLICMKFFDPPFMVVQRCP